MKSHVRTVALGLLFLNAIGAIYGGSLLIMEPTGERLQLPQYLLAYSPFQTYFVPGILLFVFNGLLSTITAILTISKHRLYPQFILYQGIILCVWLTVQVNLLQIVDVLHYIMATVAVLLIVCGWLLDGLTIQKRAAPKEK